MTQFNAPITRRRVLQTTGAATALATLPGRRWANAQNAPVKLGVMLPFSGTYAQLGEAIMQGLRLRLAQNMDLLAGRPVEVITLDTEATPPKAPQLTRRLIERNEVDFIIGPVHSGVALAMARIVAERERPIMIVPNAGANALTRAFCAPNIFRTSFSNWQVAFPCGKVMADDGRRSIITVTWNYAAGQEMMQAGAESFRAHGGEVIKDIRVPFPDVEFQAHLSEIAAAEPDAVLSFFSGGGAVKFVREYAAAGLKDRIPLYSPGFLTEGVTKAQGAAAEGIKSTLHYADTLDLPANHAFRHAYADAYDTEADVFAVQGYDTGTLLIEGMAAVQGDTSATKDLIAHLEAAMFAESPRGAWRMSPEHNPVQDFYLRQVEDGRHQVLGIADKALADPGTGCRLR